jgi:hypothetical protein
MGSKCRGIGDLSVQSRLTVQCTGQRNEMITPTFYVGDCGPEASKLAAGVEIPGGP